MKVLHLCHDYYGTKLYNQLFNKIEEFDVENYIYVSKYNKTNTQEDCRVIKNNRNYSKIDKLLYFGQQNSLCSDVISKVNISKIDCIHAHRLFAGGTIAYYLNKKYKLPYIVTIRNSDLYSFIINIKNFKSHACKILFNASKIIFISSTYRDYLINVVPRKYKQLFLEKSEVITNGIDDYFIQNRWKDHKVISKYIKLISISDISKNKNIDTTLKVCEALKRKGNKVKLTLIGSNKCSSIVERVKTKDFINYIHRQTKEEICGHLRRSDIFIMPSFHETFGLVYAEAMSQGLPVIYTKDQGFDGQYNNGHVGFAVSPRDVEEIVERICSIYSNYEIISSNCYNESERYNWNNIALHYKSIYCYIIHQ